ncbi:hypothetical protein ACT80S_06460 [Ramlibacter sp. MAHUQ-53]|uniref:hypothetical protein n=1 Tax=unclassified Ramlibacter TaxID=2617605 RepID=UPI00363FABBB
MIHPIPAEYDKSARAKRTDDEYAAHLREVPDDPLRRIDLYRDWRRERYTETGMEPAGSDAMYHFNDVGRALSSAAWCLCGREPGYATRERPRTALRHVAKTFGWRYCRGLQALYDGLVEAGVSAAERNRIRQHCNEFEADFRPRLEAAYLVNGRGQAPAVAGEVLTLFVDHMGELCNWITLTNWPSVVLEFERDLQQAAAYLRDVPIQYDTRRKPRKKRWQF